MIEALIGGLRAEQIEISAEEIADIFWLYAFMPARAPAKEVPEPIRKTPPPEVAAEPSSTAPAPLTPPPKAPVQDESSRPSAPPTARSGELLPELPGRAGETSKGVPFRVPAAVALPGALELTRALRPLMRRIASRTQRRLDEAATVDAIAEQGIWVPVMRPAQERWLEVALVVEDAFEMRPWGRTIQEFHRLLGHSGAFRDVRLWRLGMAEGGGFRLFSGSGSGRRKPAELFDAAGRRAILIVSDCSSPLWRDAAFTKTLSAWGFRQPLAVLQVLPQRMWTSTVLLDTRAVRVRSPRPGAPNAKFAMEALTRRQASRLMNGTPVPIVTLERPSLAAWASTTAGVGGASAHARLFPPVTFTPNPDRTIDKAWKRFQETASPVAQELARLLAASPLTLPIMRLVQRTMLPESWQVHLAEIFRSDLIFIREDSSDPELVRYEFRPDIRARLLDGARVSESVHVLSAALSEFIGTRVGQPLDFPAMLRDPGAAGNFPLGAEAQPFAEVAAQVLSRMGGRYRALAERLGNWYQPGPAQEVPRHDTGPPPVHILKRHLHVVSVLAFSPDGTLLASGSTGRTLRIWDVQSGRHLHSHIHESTVVSATFSPDSRQVATADISGSLFIRDISNSGEEVRTLKGQGYPLTSIAFSWDGRTLVGTSLDSVAVWDAVSGEELRRFPLTARPPLRVCSPAGESIAESDGAYVSIREMRTGTYVKFRGRGQSLYQGGSGVVAGLAFNSTGLVLAAALAEGRVVLWNSGNGNELGSFPAEARGMACLAVSADGRLVAGVSAKEELLLYETATGRVLRMPATNRIRSIAFSAPENKLATGAEDGTIALWDSSDAIAREKPALAGRAAIPRRLRILAGGTIAERAAMEAITEGLSNAGHIIQADEATAPDAVVLVAKEIDDTLVAREVFGKEGIEVIAIVVGGESPGAIVFRDPALWQAGFDRLLQRLDELRTPGVLEGVPPLPEMYYRRKDEFEALLGWVRSTASNLYLHGPRGSGRRGLAVDLARTIEVRKAFPGGVYWLPDAIPETTDSTLIVTPNPELLQGAPHHVRFLMIANAASSEIYLEDLNQSRQNEFFAPRRIPDALRTAALGRIALLARWKRIVNEFQEGRVTSWLAGREVPAEYGDEAERFAMQCAVDLLPLRVRDALQRLSVLENDGPLPEELTRGVAGSAEELDAAVHYAHSLDLMKYGEGIRPLREMVRGLLAGVSDLPELFRRITTHYIFMMRAAGDAGWSGVPDDGYFLQHIAADLSKAKEIGHLQSLLRDSNWVVRRLAADGIDALIADAALAGYESAFETVFRRNDPPTQADEIASRLAEFISPQRQPEPDDRWSFFVSYSEQDQGIEEFVRDVATVGGNIAGRPLRYFMPPAAPEASARALRRASGLLVMLSPSYVASPRAMRELQVFLDRQERFKVSSFIIPVLWLPCDVPNALLAIQFASHGPVGDRRSVELYFQTIREVAKAFDRIENSPSPLPPLPDDYDVGRPRFDATWLASVAESRGYRELLKELYSRPEQRELYWTLLTAIRSGDESWEEWFGQLQQRPE
jgi:WD40 repeat protein